METLTVTDGRVYSIVVLYDMHTKFFKSALEGISDEDAHKRLETKANHIAWLTGSLVQQRFQLANMFGVEGNQAANELFKDNQGIKDGQTYPQIATMTKDWDYITPLLREALIKADAEKYDSTFEMMPGMLISHFDMASFVTYREASCIGQIALWRRLLGYEAMKYM